MCIQKNSAIFLAGAACLILQCGSISTAIAESSSWVQESKTEAKTTTQTKEKPNAQKHRKKLSPRSTTSPSGKKNSGNSAAYIAFDQGKYLTALELAQKDAKKGDPAAHTLIGRIYGEGFGVSRDAAAAAKWYTRGAELGDINAMFALGVIAAEGRGVKKDQGAAAEMFEQAARLGHAEANYNLGLLFLNGTGKPENPYRAAQHIKYAAEQGIAAAQYDLSELYQKGVGVEPDAYEASRWIRLAAQQDMAAAQYDYAVMLLRGMGLKQDVHKALGYMRNAAENGIPGAQNRLAHMYAEGVGVKKDPVEMAKWRLIAKAGGLADEAMDKQVSGLPKDKRVEAERAAVDWQERRQVNPLSP